MTAHLPDHSAADHAAHDRQLIVAYVSGGLGAEEAGAGRALIAACRRCAVLAEDLGRIRAALAQDVATPSRPRDFRLSVADAERLRGSAWTRLLRRLGGPGLAILQPVAGAALSLGLVLVVATAALPGLGFGAAGAAPVPALDAYRSLSRDGVSSGAAATPAPVVTVPDELGHLALPEDVTTTKSEPPAAPVAPAPDPGLLLGLGLLAGGGGVLVVRLVARRAAEDPLLR